MEFDETKIDFTKTATWNVWMQLGINIDDLTGKIDVTEYYFPQAEQDKLIDYIVKNRYKMKKYKVKRKEFIKRQLSWEVLSYFPRG